MSFGDHYYARVSEHYALYSSASELTDEKVQALERKLQSNPADFGARLLVIGFYMLHQDERGLDRLRGHLSWLLENRPSEAVIRLIQADINENDLLAEIERLWLAKAALCMNDVDVLDNAASFCVSHSPAESRRLWKHAFQLQPKNVKWPRELSRVCSIMANGGTTAVQRDLAKEAIDFGNAALMIFDQGATDDYLQIYQVDFLTGLADLAIRCEFLDLAKTLGTRLLSLPASSRLITGPDGAEEMVFRNAFGPHAGHSVLGRIALIEANIDRANNHLTQMAELPIPNSPDLTLSDALTGIGEHAAVIPYLEACIQSIQEQLQKLEKSPPDFGPLLQSYTDRQTKRGISLVQVTTRLKRPLELTLTSLNQRLSQL